ncbi:hypothetical protein C8J56DRAFT_1032208 [Mycena floridula]|nr:hypothetical protein C8J56DRAFT_1032208 [Mycena floridula]
MPKSNPNGIPDKVTEPLDADIVFVHDATGSQQPYINDARGFIEKNLRGLQAKHKGKTRFRVISFRDHKEQGDAMTVDASHEFTENLADVRAALNKIVAMGGGDGPEAQIDALDAAYRSWSFPSPRADSTAKTVILITDSPPHGIGEPGDVVPKSHAKGLTPDVIRKRFVDNKIVLTVIGCEPTISKDYSTAVPWYTSFAQETKGDYFALPPKGADKTSRAMTAVSFHAVDTHRITGRWEDWIMDNAHRGHDSIAEEMHSHLSSEGEMCHDISCAKHGGSDFTYSVEPISRARVDNIVAGTLRYQEGTESTFLADKIFGR